MTKFLPLLLEMMYVAKFSEAVYVLHCFKKKTNTTSKNDKDIAADRYKSIIESRSRNGYVRKNEK
jgi:phage-related protein